MTDLTSSPVPPLDEQDHLRGQAGAPLVIFYGDFSCPYCAVAYVRLKDLSLRVAFRHFALKSRPRALALSLAAEALSCQGAFWEMHDALFSDPARTDDPHLWKHIIRLGLDLERFENDRRAPSVSQRVQRDIYGGMRGAVASTPTLIVDGVAHPGPPTPELMAVLAAGSVR
jgi:protein-disulfide isomerase